MPSIALIGPDGAGKTTLSRLLVTSTHYRFKYLYMGIAMESSNIALPTSRWVERLKQWRTRRPLNQARSGDQSKTASSGRLWATARLLNRFADEWYRQLISWIYQMRGYIVLYDRHFTLDYINDAVIAPDEQLSRRLHRWMLAHCYPMPDLVIYLDAPADVLYKRKKDLPLRELERRREGFILLGQRIPNFVQLDSTKPLHTVHAEIIECLKEFLAARQSRKTLTATLQKYVSF